MKFIVIAFVAGFTFSACGGQDGGGGRAGSAAGAGAAQKSDSTPRDSIADTAVVRAPAASKADTVETPQYKSVRGYLVRGNDELSFRPCGSRDVFLVVPWGTSRPAIVQRYRFAAPTPLTPVFFELYARPVDSTATVAEYTYRHVLIVDRVLDAIEPPPNCPRPRRGSLIESR